MSMNFSEFKRWLNFDPANPDAEYQAARRSTPEFIQAAADSDKFEQKLLRASRIEAPASLAESLKAIAQTTPQSSRKGGFKWNFAIAAGLLLAFAVVLLQQQLTPEFDSVEEYVAYHYVHDGYDFLGLAGQPGHAVPSAAELGEMLAALGLQMKPPLSGQVQLVKFCPTPEGSGLHLVMNTGQGLVTVFIMPGLEVQDGELFAFDGMAASLLSLPGRNASVAIVGQPEQLDSSFGAVLRDSVLQRTAGA